MLLSSIGRHSLPSHWRPQSEHHHRLPRAGRRDHVPRPKPRGPGTSGPCLGLLGGEAPNALGYRLQGPWDPWHGLVRTSASRVRVLTAHETGTLMRAGGGPYQLSVCAVDSVYTSGETIHAWNYATISPVEEP